MAEMYGGSPSGRSRAKVSIQPPDVLEYVSSSIFNVIESFDSMISILLTINQYATPFVGSLTGTSAISPALAVRLIWIKQNEGEKFSITNPIHINQLKDIYLSIGIDWISDPILSKL